MGGRERRIVQIFPYSLEFFLSINQTLSVWFQLRCPNIIH